MAYEHILFDSGKRGFRHGIVVTARFRAHALRHLTAVSEELTRQLFLETLHVSTAPIQGWRGLLGGGG